MASGAALIVTARLSRCVPCCALPALVFVSLSLRDVEAMPAKRAVKNANRPLVYVIAKHKAVSKARLKMLGEMADLGREVHVIVGGYQKPQAERLAKEYGFHGHFAKSLGQEKGVSPTSAIARLMKTVDGVLTKGATVIVDSAGKLGSDGVLKAFTHELLNHVGAKGKRPKVLTLDHAGLDPSAFPQGLGVIPVDGRE